MLRPPRAVGDAAARPFAPLDQGHRRARRLRCSACKVPDAPAPTTATDLGSYFYMVVDLDLVGKAEPVEDARGLVADHQHRPVQPALILADAILHCS